MQMSKQHSQIIIKKRQQIKLRYIAEKALNEFHNLKNKIEDKGITVTCLKGSKDCPDIFFQIGLSHLKIKQCKFLT